MTQSSEAKVAWLPTASREALLLRAAALRRIRQFFVEHEVLEVTTPVMVRAAVSDVHLASARVVLPGDDLNPRFLQTSPEYAMKRLLAGGSGDIYQMCPVVRGFERGRLHNPEFTMLEWYRTGFTLERLMSEVQSLIEAVAGRSWQAEFPTYVDAFRDRVSLDPLAASLEALRARAVQEGLAQPDSRLLTRDSLLDFLLTALVAPALGRGRLSFLHRYPASQAALARLDPADERVALRFEVYLEGVELANGFDELFDASQQQVRFEADLQARRAHGLPAVRIDKRFLAALNHGLPQCCGVALGLERLLMLVAGHETIDSVLTFPDEIA